MDGCTLYNESTDRVIEVLLLFGNTSHIGHTDDPKKMFNKHV
jgi:hypothetical protein